MGPLLAHQACASASTTSSRSASITATAPRPWPQPLVLPGGHGSHRLGQDALTGLPNRTLLHDRTGQAIRQSDRELSPAALLIDLDRFKEVNDTVGHHYGDQLLVQVGQRLQGALRIVDTVARLGGDLDLLPHGDAAWGVRSRAAR
jgi:GGDEF domain-containing protein